MKESNWIKYKIEVREKLNAFTLKILELSEKISKTTKANIINYQLTTSGTSVYSNHRAASRGRLKAEFFCNLPISIEEADEAEMWLNLGIV